MGPPGSPGLLPVFNLSGTRWYHLENGLSAAPRRGMELTQVDGHRGFQHLGPRAPGRAWGPALAAEVGPCVGPGGAGGRSAAGRGVWGLRGQVVGDAAVAGRGRPERGAGHGVARAQDAAEEVIGLETRQHLVPGARAALAQLHVSQDAVLVVE